MESFGRDPGTDAAGELKRAYAAYVDTFRDAAGELPEMMALKLRHTGLVLENATLIATGEGFDDETARVTRAAALLHDTGRYEQLRRYNTFRDADSVDHAVFSHDIVVAKGWLDAWPARERRAILAAVLNHNRREVPDGLAALEENASHAVRDADKLDIFRVFEARVRETDWRHDRKAFWDLPVEGVNPVVLACVRTGRQVNYPDIHSLADFILVQVGWLRFGLHFGTSRKLAAERGHAKFRRDFLLELGVDIERELGVER